MLDSILLRRTKAGRADEMVLPPKVVTIEAYLLDEKEKDFYDGLYTQVRGGARDRWLLDRLLA